MTKSELKELVKQHFNLVEATQMFAEATLEDGTKVSTDMEGKFEVGQKLFVIDEEGEKVAAPEGEHVTESGIQLIVDAEGMLTGVKYPDAEGEGSADLAEEEIREEEMSAEVEESTSEEAMAEHEEEEAMEEEMMPKLEDVIEIIGEVVEEKMAKMKEKMAMIEEEVKMMKDKMSAFASDSAEEKTVPTAKFSAISKPLNEKRYNAMLNKLSK